MLETFGIMQVHKLNKIYNVVLVGLKHFNVEKLYIIPLKEEILKGEKEDHRKSSKTLQKWC